MAFPLFKKHVHLQGKKKFLFLMVWNLLLSPIWILCVSVGKCFLISFPISFQLGKPLSLVSYKHSSRYFVYFLPIKSFFSFWEVMIAYLTYPGPRGFETACFPLSQREDFSLAMWCRRWLNSYVHRCFKTQQDTVFRVCACVSFLRLL